MSEMDERVVFEGSGKRGAQLYSDGNGYFYRVKERRSMTSWKLVCHNGLCRGSATLFNPNSVDDDRTIVHKHPHACEANKRLMEVLELKKRIMQRCREEETSLKQIYNEETSKCDEEVSSCLTWDGIESAMFKTRQKGGYPQIPLTVDDYITGLQDESARFNEVYEQSFLNGVVEEGEDIGIIFLVKPMSTPLTESDELYMDSSFRCVPKKPKFDRLLTIMAVNKGYAFPVVFCLLTKTSRALYEKIFAHLKEQLPDLAPQNIYTGYESDLKAALLRSFPSTKVVGTFFHYGQSICLKMQKLGLLALFRSNSDFNKAVHMLIALALLPPDKINEGLSAVEGFFDDAKSTQQVMCRDYVNTQHLFRYVKEHWIGRVGSQVFSVYGQRERTADCEDRLNRRLLWPLGRKSNPNIWIFQKNLVNMARQCVSDFMQLNYDEIVRGYRRTKWLLMEGKVKSASTKLNSDRISVRQFLLDISFKCSMLIPPMADSDAEEGGDDDEHDDEFNDDDHVYFNMTLASQSQDHLLMAEEEEIETETEQLSIAETPRGQKKSSIKNDDYLSMSSPRGQKRPLTNDDDHLSMSSPHGQKRPLTKNEDGAKKTRLVAPDRNDACDNFGRNVASKLRAMNKIQRLAAEKIINETLFYGELEKLSLQFATNFGATIEDFNTVIEQEVESDFISKLI